ncbi:hypothetical protein Q7C36_020614 [Tachysurus vachellii]|uniref:Uncharacterized protein n=1 Tax=Tachysurus vachellii TaxID=175792 RepID=A0AA88IQP5_TACVA|nr:hypothetical protein Q7C36_020614 [Tachysurus vachellii]
MAGAISPALMKLRRQSVLAVSAHLHMHGNASAIHQRSTHSVSVHERARMILLNSQGDEERPFKGKDPGSDKNIIFELCNSETVAGRDVFAELEAAETEIRDR